MNKVETYDQYRHIYADPLDETSTLLHSSSGFKIVNGEDLSEADAKVLVSSLYEESKTLGSSYYDKLLNLDNGYAELVITFADGKKLNRVIYIV